MIHQVEFSFISLSLIAKLLLAPLLFGHYQCLQTMNLALQSFQHLCSVLG